MAAGHLGERMTLGIMLGAALLAQATFSSAPPSRRGFQGALTLGRAVARGSIVSDLRHREFLPAATEVEAQLGWKLSDRWSGGVYVGGGVSTPGEESRDLCDEANVECAGTSRRAGVMVKLDLLPSRAWNPWVALGSGLQWHDVRVARVVPSAPVPGAPTVLRRSELEMRGVEPLRLMTGIDFRAARAVGVGVRAAVSWGRYHDVEASSPSSTVRPTGNLAEGARASHVWFTLGLHAVLFP
jgi:hypothetical protein